MVLVGLLKSMRSTILIQAFLILALAGIAGLIISPGTAGAEDTPREENPIVWTNQRQCTVADIAADLQGNIFQVTCKSQGVIELTKFDQDGVEKWAQQLYQGEFLSWHASVSANQVGEVFVSYSCSNSPNTVTSKYDSQGTLLWTANLSAHFRNQVFLAAGQQGGVYVAGTNDNTIALPGLDVFLGYFNEAGVQQWTSTVGSSGQEQVVDITVSPTGEVYICGTTDGTMDAETASGSWCDLFIAAFKADGQEKWIRQFGFGKYGHKLTIPGGIACDGAGNIYFTYGTVGDAFAPSGLSNWSVVKFDRNSVWIWSAPFDILAYSRERNDIAIDNWGNIYTICVYGSINPTTGQEEYQSSLIKFNSNGEKLLVKELGAKAGNQLAFPRALTIGEDGSIILAGNTAASFNGYPFIGTVAFNTFMVKFLGDIDTDGDGLLDRWEINGYQTREGFVDLPKMGADPERKDIFVEVDWLAGEQPDPAGIAEIFRKFKDAPVSNVDGSTGISLHVDFGRDSTMDPLTGSTWGDFSRASQIPRSAGDGLDFMGSFDESGEFVWDEFDKLKKAHFGRERSPIFRYCIFAKGPAEGLCTFDDDDNVVSSASGMSKGIPSSDFFVSQGFWGANNGPVQQAGTFMHELGHTLGLKHGGADHVGYKPNYFSIMNYLYQTSGLIYNGGDGLMDYSRFGHIADLDENRLDETKGVTSSTGEDLSKYGLRWTIWAYGDQVVSQNDVKTANWDAQGDLETDVAIDINQDRTIGVLTGYFNDWENLSYKGGNVGMGVTNAMLPAVTKPAAPELTTAEDAKLVRDYRVGLEGPGILAAERGQDITCEFTVSNAGSKDDSYTISASSSQGWADLGGVPDTIDLGSGENRQVAIPVAIPAEASTGQEESITLTVTSTHNPLMMNRKTAILTVKKKATGNTNGILEKLDLSSLNARISDPVIYGDKMVCAVTPTKGDPYIGIYSLSAEAMVEQIDYRDPLTPYERSFHPNVDDIDFNGDYVVWHLISRYREVELLFFADLTQDTAEIIRIGDADQADLYANKLVFKDVNGVKTYDLAARTITEITVTNSGPSFVIDGERLFWRYLPFGSNKPYKYYMYDLITGTQTELLSTEGSLRRFDVSGNKLVYERIYDPTKDYYGLIVLDVVNNSKREIFFKNWRPEPTYIDDESLTVNGDLAAFVYKQNVWICDLEAEVCAQVTTDGDYDYTKTYYNPRIHENRIVFTKDGEVYIYTLTPPSTAPITTLTSSTAADGQNIAITLTPDLPNALTYYQWDDDSSKGWSQYIAPLNAPEGRHSLYFFSQDRAGTNETVNSQSFTVDTTAPITYIKTDPAEPDGYGLFAEPPVITLEPDESGSTTYYQWDFKEAAGFIEYSDPIIGLTGEHTLYFYSVDQLGNQEEIKSAVIRVQDNSDTTPSVTSITLNPELPDDNGWYSEAPQISLSTGDNAAIYY